MKAALVLTVCICAFAAGGSAHASPATAGGRASQMKAVVRAWSEHLNAGDNAGAARLFAVPAVVIQPPYEYRLVSRKELAEWHASLPCAGHIVSITVKGSRATVVFRLADRTTSKCDGPGQLAAARFSFAHGKIAVWEQVPVPKKPATPALPTA